MGLINIRPTAKAKKTVVKKKFEEKANLKKLLFFVTIVNDGIADNVVKLMENCNCNTSFIEKGNGTANRAVLEILGVTDNKKEVVFSLISEDIVDTVKQELDIFFQAAKRNRGIGFSIKVDSVIGVKLYKFLTNTL